MSQGERHLKLVRRAPRSRPLATPVSDMRKWRDALLRSPLTPAEKLVLLLASEGATAAGDVPMDHGALAERLGTATRTVRCHLGTARAAGWLGEYPSIKPASTRTGRRPMHYRAMIPNGG